MVCKPLPVPVLSLPMVTSHLKTNSDTLVHNTATSPRCKGQNHKWEFPLKLVPGPSLWSLEVGSYTHIYDLLLNVTGIALFGLSVAIVIYYPKRRDL